MSSEIIAKEQFTTKHNKTKQNRKVTEGIGSITVQKQQHQVDSPLGREISWEAAMTGFANLFKRILRSEFQQL